MLGTAPVFLISRSQMGPDRPTWPGAPSENAKLVRAGSICKFVDILNASRSKTYWARAGKTSMRWLPKVLSHGRPLAAILFRQRTAA